MKVTICGAGRGGLSMAAELTLQGHEVTLFQIAKFESVIKSVVEQKGITITGATASGKTGKVMPKSLTMDPGKAIPGAEVLMLTVPAYGHEPFMQAIAPHLQDGQILVVNTGYWASLRFQSLLKKFGKKVIMAETELLIYLTKGVGPAQVHIDGTKNEVSLAAMPASKTSFVLSRVNQLYPQFKGVHSVLEINLTNINPFIHMPILLLSTAGIENLGSSPCYFYRNGCTQRASRIIEEVDRERDAMGRALGLKLQSLLQRQIKMYGHVGSQGKTFYEAVKTNQAYQAFSITPGDYAFEMAEEDVPYGLIPVVTLAEQINVQVPTMRALVQLHSLGSGRNFWAEGATPKQLGLIGMGAEAIRQYVETGEKG
jgi:opine dehydrogenase